MTKDLVDIEMMAHGGSVLEIARGADGKWSVVPDSKFARRITASTEMRISGPAAGHERIKTKADPTGTKVLGMLNNCAGAHHPVGHVADLRGELQRLFLEQEGGRGRARMPRP